MSASEHSRDSAVNVPYLSASVERALDVLLSVDVHQTPRQGATGQRPGRRPSGADQSSRFREPGLLARGSSVDDRWQAAIAEA